MDMDKKTIVITGCSSGFGRITALTLAEKGWHVFGTVRKETDRESLLAEAVQRGCPQNLTILFCDITQQEQIEQLMEQVTEHLRGGEAMEHEESAPRLDALMNNAGTAYGGPIELLPVEDLRNQFEINVFAQIAVTQAFMPLLKEARGIIIMVSSIGGRVATPIAGAYNASKAALEFLSDALRVELVTFGVRVVLVEPISSPTDIWNTSLERALQRIGSQRGGPYERLLQVSERFAKRFSKRGFPPQVFADTIARILESDRPGTRYAVPRSAAIPMTIGHLLPDRLRDYLVRRTLKW
jgi:NAD(P)-dependent dehydrogenase (short-subunit alcohol dehydrogenase family)